MVNHHNNFTPDKPFMGYKEQITLLRSRNLLIPFEDEEFVIHSLQTYSYYDLINGNTDKLIVDKKNDKFENNISFRQIVQIRIIEDRLKSLFLTQILAIEKAFSSKLSYLISENYGVDSGPCGYLKKRNYVNGDITKTTMKQLRKIRDGDITYRDHYDALIYYREHHNHIPPWILINNLMFGEKLNWYKSLIEDDKTVLSSRILSISIDDIETRKSVTVEVLDVLREFRNFFAHNSVLSKMKCDRQLNNKDLYNAINDKEIFGSNELDNCTSNNIYACLLSILLTSNDPDQLVQFVGGLEQTWNLVDEETQQLIFTRIFGFPANTMKRVRLFLERKLQIVIE